MTTPTADILIGDVFERLAELPEAHFHCCVTSPPYWGLRDYGVVGQIGSEATPAEFVAVMVRWGRAVWRVLRDDGQLWMNLGDTYNAYNANRGEAHGANKKHHEIMPDAPRGLSVPGLKPKDLCGMPWRVALALQADGWTLRQDIVWQKPSAMPESVRDRCTKAHEYIFLLTKRPRYFYDAEAIAEPARYFVLENAKVSGDYSAGAGRNDDGLHRSGGFVNDNATRNARSVWTIASQGYAEAHFATFPEKLPERCILAGTSAHGCCAACGAPWRRVVEPTPETEAARAAARNGQDWYARNFDNSDKRRTAKSGDKAASGYTSATVTKGWQPTCTCSAAVVPCRVLDPFLGSGTTLAVALRHGRSGTGIELNPAYAELARKRIAKSREAAPLFLAAE